MMVPTRSEARMPNVSIVHPDGTVSYIYEPGPNSTATGTITPQTVSFLGLNQVQVPPPKVPGQRLSLPPEQLLRHQISLQELKELKGEASKNDCLREVVAELGEFNQKVVKVGMGPSKLATHLDNAMVAAAEWLTSNP